MEEYKKALALWSEANISSSAQLNELLNSFRILFAYHSGKMENNEITYHDTREVFQDGAVHCFRGNPRTLFSIQNQKDCDAWLYPQVFAKKTLTIDMVKEIHFILASGLYDEQKIKQEERPGSFKKCNYAVGIHAVATAPKRVQANLHTLLESVNSSAQSDIKPEALLETAAYLHARFEHIHPFADGNGRVGRTMVNFFLMSNCHPPLIIHEQDRDEYYAALQEYDETETFERLYHFFKLQTAKTWEKTIARREDDTPPANKTLREFLS